MGQAELIAKIRDLKKQKNALLLAHFYQEGPIQDLADHVGDSLELAKRARDAKRPLVIFAGVHFMAEGAKILNPKSKVVVPDLRAGCSLANSCPPEAFKKWIGRYPNPYVISYINCSAEIKALSDIICTSTNAAAIVKNAPPDRPILFGPDRNLGAYVAKITGRELESWPGACIVHETFSLRKIIALQTENPEAELIAHPECESEILDRAHFIGSTSALIDYSGRSPSQSFIVATESGILHQMRLKFSNKQFIPAPPNHACACNDCPYMKLNTLEKLYQCLEEETPEIEVNPELSKQALKPLLRMLDFQSGNAIT